MHRLEVQDSGCLHHDPAAGRSSRTRSRGTMSANVGRWSGVWFQQSLHIKKGRRVVKEGISTYIHTCAQVLAGVLPRTPCPHLISWQ